MLIRHDPIPAGAQQGGDRFAVALIHLAAVSFDVDAIHGGSGSD